MPGTFAFEQAGIDSPDAPDIIVSFRWSDETSSVGLLGTVISDSEKRLPGQGIHASLSRFDMHNTLIAAGPGFKEGFVDRLPSGNMDVAPTVMHILGIKPEGTLDGRVLCEALSNGDSAPVTAQTVKIVAQRRLGELSWNQYLQVSKIGTTRYYDEGNGAASPHAK